MKNLFICFLLLGLPVSILAASAGNFHQSISAASAQIQNQPEDGMKSGMVSFPEIKMIAVNAGKTVSTSIKFISGTTKGLDPGYDAGYFGLDPSIKLYTWLVQDNGTKFTIQCLPPDGYRSVIIPVGFESVAGGNVVFSAQLLDLPSGCKVIFEDRLTSTFTDLSLNTFTVGISTNSVISGRFFLNYYPPVIWSGFTNTDWNTDTNWSINAVPTESDNLTIPNVMNKPAINQAIGTPTVCNNLTVESGAVLTVKAGKALTVTGTLTNNSTEGIRIESNAEGTGSIIAGAVSGTGSVHVSRYMTGNIWHMVSSPLTGQTVEGFLLANSNIPTKPDGITRGMMDFNTTTDLWNPWFTNSTTGNMVPGKAYVVRTSSDAAVNFTGTLNVGTTNVFVSRVGNGWNCIGNPFPSTLNMTAVANSFYSENLARLDDVYSSLYFWDESISNTQYTLINFSTPEFYASAGQGFFVKPVANSNIVFTPGMQVHQGVALKSGTIEFPEIKLIALNDAKRISTSIKFIAGTSNGLDKGYDSGFLQLDPAIGLYTLLVEDNGVDLGLQCLPGDDFGSLIIPVGIDSKAGGSVLFSAEAINLSAGCKIILEDKQNKTFTDLSKDSYSTTLEPNSVVADRFQLHTSSRTTGLEMNVQAGNLSAYAVSNMELVLKGQVGSQAFATVYDLTGSKVVTQKLNAGMHNIIRLPTIKSGIYMLLVKDNNKIQGFKVPVSE